MYKTDNCNLERVNKKWYNHPNNYVRVIFLRRIIAVIMSLIMATALCIHTVAVTVDREEFYPIIIVPGYSSSGLYMENDDSSKTHVWGLDFELIMKRVLARSVDIAKGIDDLSKGNAQYIADVVGGEFADMFEHMRCNPDGSSVYNIKTYCSTAADSNNTYLIENEDGKYRYETEIMEMFGSYIGDDFNDYIFNFNTDFRMNVETCAGNLNSYIDSVLEYTGAEKVNIYCVSHGGQIGATFLNLYGQEKADKINNMIMTIPAIGGSNVAVDFFKGNIAFDEENLLTFVENGMMFENDYHWLMAEENLDFLDDILNCILPYFQHIMQYWGSMWDFVPNYAYGDVRGLIDNEESAPLLAKTDRFHNEIYPEMWTRLQDCVDAGINIYIIAGSGINDIAGSQVNCDSFIPVVSSTGSACAPMGERYNDGYQTLNTNCTDASHNHLSPSMEIDASAGYLPEYTWIVDGLYHGMTLKSDYCTDLITTLMYTDERVDVHTFREFPQFHADTNRCQSVSAQFNSSVEGYVSSDDTSLVVTNCSKKYDMRIVSVSCNGMDINFDCSFMKDIPTGGSIEIPFKGDIPEVSRTTAQVTVNYILVGALTPIGARTLDFTVMNGDLPLFDSENPTVTPTVPTDTLLDMINGHIPFLSVQKFVTMVYNALKALILNIVSSM